MDENKTLVALLRFSPQSETKRANLILCVDAVGEKKDLRLKIHSHCSYCGHPFPEATAWPRRCLSCNNTSYLNPLPVVVVLLPIGNGLLLIRRNIEPQKGTLTLPGGYLDLGETWQQGAIRELEEETGIAVTEDQIRLYDVQNGLDHTLVIFGLAKRQPAETYRPFSSAETQEIVVIEQPIELGFPMHTNVVERFFAEVGKPSAVD